MQEIFNEYLWQKKTTGRLLGLCFRVVDQDDVEMRRKRKLKRRLYHVKVSFPVQMLAQKGFLLPCCNIIRDQMKCGTVMCMKVETIWICYTWIYKWVSIVKNDYNVDYCHYTKCLVNL